MKFCPGCKQEKLETAFNKSHSLKSGFQRLCKECERAYQVRHRAEKSAQVKQRDLSYYHRNRDKIAEKRRQARAEGKHDHWKIAQRRKYYAMMSSIHEAYGRACACCGESEPSMLEIDHVNNDGNVHRKQYNARGNSCYRFYKDIVDQGFPSSFQLLCANCNKSKHKNGGICAHKLSESVETNCNPQLPMAGEAHGVCFPWQIMI